MGHPRPTCILGYSPHLIEGSVADYFATVLGGKWSSSNKQGVLERTAEAELAHMGGLLQDNRDHFERNLEFITRVHQRIKEVENFIKQVREVKKVDLFTKE